VVAVHAPSRVLILGGGTGGTSVANRLRRATSVEEVEITVIDQDDRHVYQPGLLFVPFGLATPDELVRHRGRQLHRGIAYEVATIDEVDLEQHEVHLVGGRTLDYDVLVVATGAALQPEETEGLTGAGWLDRTFTFYDLRGAAALAGALAAFDGGRIVVDVVDLPIKCPVAPLELCFLADWFFRDRGIRHKVDITYVTPLDAAFTRPVAARELGDLLEEKQIELVTDFSAGAVDGGGGVLTSYDGQTVPFDLGVVVPLHGGAPPIARSPGLGDELGFVPVDAHTLQSTAAEGVFAIGDAAAVPTSKAGSVTHFEAEAVVANVLHHLAGEPLEPRFDGHTNCFVETGFGKALLLDFDYETEPLPGRYPGPVGLPLLRESRLNHLGKLLFQTLYWHSLLPGRDLPFIHADMPTAGKDLAASSAQAHGG
jgi:sulfide:quinone oxidoreductase